VILVALGYSGLPASIAVPRRIGAPRPDAIDGRGRLLRTRDGLAARRAAGLLHDSAAKRERRGPPPDLARARKRWLRERIQHTNRIRGLLFGQGVTNYNPLHKNRRVCLEELRTGDGRSMPAHLKSEILREIDRLELVLRQISEVEG